jgi:hypothetical protein
VANRPHLPFQAALGALGAVFVAGCVAVYFAYVAQDKADADLRRVTSAVNALASGAALPEGGDPVALNADNVASATADLAALQARQEALRNAIAGAPETHIDSRFVGIANELGTQIQESVSRWRRLAQSKDVRLPSREEACFGFRRYVLNRGTQPQRLYREVDRQRKMVEWILETLVEAKAPAAPLLIQSIDREPIETFPAVSGPAGESQVFTLDTPSADALAVRLQSDEFVLSGHTFRRPGLVGSFAFRVRFVGRSDTLRAFVNLIQNSGKPVAISGIEVAQPSAETLKELFAIGANLGAGQAAPAPAPFFPALGSTVGADAPAAPAKAERLPVISTGAAEFTVRLEYLFPVTETPAAPAK